MQCNGRRGYRWGLFAAFLLLAGSLCAQVPSPALDADSDSLVNIELPSATLDQVVALYANLTGRTAIRASSLQGRIVLQGNGPLTKDDAIVAIENVLLANNFVIVKQGDKFFKVVSAPTAKQEGVEFSGGDDPLEPSDRLASRVFRLKYVEAKDIDPVLRPMMHAFGQMTPFPRTNALLITDTSANLLEMQKVIDHLDRPLEAKVKAKFYTLKHGKARDVAARITEVLTASSGAGGGNQPKTPTTDAVPGALTQAAQPATPAGGELIFNEEAIVVGKVTISADERTNQIILLTREINIPFFNQMIEKLDADTACPVILQRIPLRYAEAEVLSGLLAEVLGQVGGGSSKRDRLSNKKFNETGSRSRPNAPATASGVSAGAGAKGRDEEEISVYADSRTNSLIALGVKDRIEWVERFIKDVDVPLPQVLLQGVVVEVTLNRTDSLGVEVLARGTAGDFQQAGLINNLNINPISAASVVTGNIPAGAVQGLNYYLSLKNKPIDVIIQALAQNSSVRILSQPLIQTSHNQEATISVGEERPVVTASQSLGATTSTNNVPLNTFNSTVEFKPINLELTILPLINPGGLVVLDISQKIDDVSGSVLVNGNDTPIISHRQANALVSVQDGETIILGGLISHREDVAKSGVPLLSDIPLLGYLFSSTTKKKVRTELMLLLRPTVLNTPEAASEEASQRRKQLELYNRKEFLQKRNLNDEIEKIARPAAVPAQPVDLEK
jgi:general secretion pathway protein D